MSTKPFTVSDHNSNSIVTIYGYSATQFVVGVAGKAPYTSIQTAINDAYTLASSSDSAQVVYVKPGLYLENLSFKPGVAVVGTEVPSTLDNVSYDPTDVSQNYGVFIKGTHTFDESLGEFNVKNIIFFCERTEGDIINFTGSTYITSTYTFENCKFIFINPSIDSAKFFNCTSSNAAYEGLAVFFKSCLFYAKDGYGDDDYCMFYLLGANGTKYTFDNCTIKSTWDSTGRIAYLYAIEAGSGDAWYVNFSDCKIDKVQLIIQGGTSEIILSIDNCNLTSYDTPVINFGDSSYMCKVINSYIYISEAVGYAIAGDFTDILDLTGTIFASQHSSAPKTWLANIAHWPNITNSSIVSSGPVYCVYTDNQNQVAAAANTAYPMRFNTLEEGYGITVVNDSQSPPQPTKITFEYPGVYNLQFSAQLDRVSGSGNADVNIWLRKNGTTGAANVANTDTKITMSGGASAAKTVAAWNLMFTAVAGDYVQLCWATEDIHIEIIHADAVTTAGQERPATPSVILTVYKIK